MSERQTQQGKSAGNSTLQSASSGLLQRKCDSCGQHTIAGGTCGSCEKRKGVLQRKLMIGASNDSLELEADRVADEVMAAQGHYAVSNSPPRIQRFTGQTTGDAGTAPASVDRVLSSSGNPLDPTLRHDMEQRFGHDFSNVRVHSDAAASLSAQDVNAQAYTVGRHLVFGAGRYTPATRQGQRLLAHELTHVLQQTGGDPLASGNGTRNADSASSISTTALTVQRQPNDEPISLHSSYNPGAHVYGDLVTEAGKIHHWLQKHPATSPERTALETQLAKIIQTANRLGQRMGYAPLTFVDLTPASKSPEQVDALNKLKSLSQPQTPSPFLQAPKASAPPERKPAVPVLMPAYLNWQPLFLEGLSAGLQSDAKLQAGWATLKAQLAAPDSQLSFAGGSAAGAVPGAVVAVADIPYSLLKAYAEFSLQTNFGHVSKEQLDKTIEEVIAGIGKFVARIPELVTEVANEPKQVGGWAAALISEKIREDLFLEEPDKKAVADDAFKTDKSADPVGLPGIKLPDLYKASQVLLMRGKPGEKGRFIFNKGVACGMALGYTLMNIAMLFVGPEEMIGKAASIGAKGLEALKAGGLWRRLGTIAESIPELRGLLSAKRAATEAKAVAAAAKEGEALAGVAKAAGGEASLGKLEADALAALEKNPKPVPVEPGHRRVRISPDHEIVEVPTAGGGIGCELHSPPPFPKVPCPKGMGKADVPSAKSGPNSPGLGPKTETIDQFRQRGGEIQYPPVTKNKAPNVLPSERTFVGEPTVPANVKGERGVDARNPKSANVDVAEDHHIASKYDPKTKALFKEAELSIDNEINQIADFQEHGQLRGWVQWQEPKMVDGKLEPGKYVSKLRGHHPDYKEWVFEMISKGRPAGTTPAQLNAHIRKILDQLAPVIKANPELLTHGPKALRDLKLSLDLVWD